MGTHTFVARTPMPVSSDALFSWHTRPGAFQRLTPPWEPVKVLKREGTGIQPGARVTVGMKVAGIPTEWIAEHSAYEEGRLFVDRQVKGPFREFVHAHRTLPSPFGTSILEDEIEWSLPLGALGALGNPVARRRLERTFLYRHAITGLDLQRHARFAAAPRLTVAISGASGVIGSALSAFLTTAGHTVKRLVRGAARSADDIAWDPRTGIDPRALEGVDAVVHLAGAPVATRWTDAAKREIRDSRVTGTKQLATAIAGMTRKPRVLISGSAVGYYGSRGDEVLDESSAPGDDFLASVCREWETATAPAQEAGIRTVHLRIGVVLSGQGGALEKMLPVFLAGVGGTIGSGRQWMSWVSLEDVLGVMESALLENDFRGAYNLTAPEPVEQRAFAKALGGVLRRPSFAPTPAVAIKLAFGEMGAGTVLASQRARPGRLIEARFLFVHAELEHALRFHLGRLQKGSTELIHQ